MESGTGTVVQGPRLWGYAGVYPGEFRLWDGDEFRNRYRFLASHGFKVTGLELSVVRDAEKRVFLRDYVREQGFRHNVHFGCEYFREKPEVLLAEVEHFLRELAPVREELGVVLVTTTVGPYHRFMRDPSLAYQMERLRLVLTPLAAGLAEWGVRLGIENHCDYHLTDLVALCDEVPGLGIFWDTGNGLITGEKPLDVSRKVAPYVVGTHFKDFYCVPEENELKLVVRGASLGDGDVGLESIYRDLLAYHPRPEELVMEIELIPDAGLDPWDSLERSKRFVEKLSGHAFLYPEIPVKEGP